jgi:hypothetical protein
MLGTIPAASAGARTFLDPDSIDVGMDVQALDLEQARLHRQAIYARHCRFLEDPYARKEFARYQRRKCEYDYIVGNRERLGIETPLTAEEERFLERLGERERQLRTGGTRTLGGRAFHDPAAIANRSQFTGLSDSVMARLLRDGCVALPGGQQQLFHVYEQNEYSMLPSFITTDLMLQVHHLYFDYTLRTIEEERLIPAAQALCQGMAERLRQRLAAGDVPSGAVEQAVLYFALAEGLCATDSVWIPPPWIEQRWDPVLRKTAGLILGATTEAEEPLMGRLDYTKFRPRGHYTRSAALTRYFRVMSWLGIPGFVLSGGARPIETALVMSYVLTHDPELQRLYDSIYEPTAFYVGPSDDIQPALVRTVADGLCGETSSLRDWLGRSEEIRTALEAADPRLIRTGSSQVRLMGQRYIPDSEMFQRLTELDLRPFPTVLDLFGVLRVPVALEALRQTPLEWPAYWSRLEKFQSEFEDLPPSGAADNLYWRWIHLLRTLNASPPENAPPFMGTPAWAVKNLNAGAASWAELRHDTILYAKQSGEECGGGGLPPRIPGFVEPRPDVFGEMRELTAFTRSKLGARGLLSPRHDQIGSRIEEMLRFLESVGQKELAGQALTDGELERIRVFGADVEYLTTELLLGRAARWYELSGPDRRLAVVADVHTNRDSVLEAGVGNADELYVLVDFGGDLYIMRGAVFSYYEFTHPRDDRLTDEKWQEMLDQGRAPDRPPWMRGLLGREAAPEPSHRYVYSSGC